MIVRSWSERASIQTVVIREMICVWMRFNAKANKCIYYIDIGADTHRAVSYTHLRAHETRHDLVCRLLLEKKKNAVFCLKTKNYLLYTSRSDNYSQNPVSLNTDE